MTSTLNLLLLMKLDVLRSLLIAIGVVVAGAYVIYLGITACRYDSFKTYPSLWRGPEPSVPKFVKRWLALGVLLIGTGALAPSTSQAAVALLVPPVAGSEFVQKDIPAEARELYGLAKKWLSDKASE